MLMLAVSLLMALSLALSLGVNPVKAQEDGEGKWQSWWGTQYIMPISIIIDKLKIAGRNIEIYGSITMLTEGGYTFDDGEISVGYEIIHYMKIYVPDDYVLDFLKEALSDPNIDPAVFFQNNPHIIAMLYSYPRFGRFTWYTWEYEVVGKGTFRADGWVGSLWVSGPRIVVKGKFWPTTDGQFIYHTGVYITTDGH